MSEQIQIEIVYAQQREQTVIPMKVVEGTTVAQALEQSGMAQKHPELDLKTAKVGIYGKISKPDTVLRNHDRIEIYRPLIADPKEVRKKRAEEGKAMKKGAGEEAA
jgi:hypothetical protein